MSASGGQAPGHSHAAEPAPAKGGSSDPASQPAQSDPASQPAQSDPASQPAQVITADQQEPQGQEDQEAGDVLPAGLGLAMIAGLADDVQVSRTRDGLIITMSWPSVASAR
ncbi:MAG TPA: ATP-binding protein [Streptosporangiaceae bacterium]|nr:ATP-binding protein [Streptosporangiaceae bacterium]